MVDIFISVIFGLIYLPQNAILTTFPKIIQPFLHALKSSYSCLFRTVAILQKHIKNLFDNNLKVRDFGALFTTLSSMPRHASYDGKCSINIKQMN